MDSHGSSPNVYEKIVEKGVYLSAKFFLTGIAAYIGVKVILIVIVGSGFVDYITRKSNSCNACSYSCTDGSSECSQDPS
jgi:hypothetical protein